MIGRVSLAFLLLAGCADRAATKEEAIAAANAYLGPMHLPVENRVIDAIDMGDRWRLSYGDLPGHGGTGGGIIAVVNKRNGEVVHYETTQ